MRCCVARSGATDLLLGVFQLGDAGLDELFEFTHDPLLCRHRTFEARLPGVVEQTPHRLLQLTLLLGVGAGLRRVNQPLRRLRQKQLGLSVLLLLEKSNALLTHFDRLRVVHGTDARV